MTSENRVSSGGYRGRLAPTPTGCLHLGHAATFATAAARAAGGTLLLRIEDLDPQRCRPEYTAAALEDLAWLGFVWQEGPGLGGPHDPYVQSQRRAQYVAAWRTLRDGGWIYPCARSRKDVAAAVFAPHDEEPLFPPEWRTEASSSLAYDSPAGINWRFRVPDGETLSFEDGHFGHVEKTALRDFGDFLVWNRDDVPAYELAVVVDDLAMGITEVVRGADLLTSTARQLLLYRAFRARPPEFFHCPLVCDETGRRLAKRDAARTLRALRAEGWTPERVRDAVPNLLAAAGVCFIA